MPIKKGFEALCREFPKLKHACINTGPIVQVIIEIFLAALAEYERRNRPANSGKKSNGRSETQKRSQ